MDYQKCPVCTMPARVHDTDLRGDDTEVDCVRCGAFKLVEDMDYWLRAEEFSPQQVAAISSYIRRNTGLTIDRASLPRLRALRMPSVPEKIARLMMLLSKRHPTPGENINAPVWSLQRLRSIILGASQTQVYDEASLAGASLEDAAYLGEPGVVDSDELHWLLYDCLLPQGLLKSGRINGYVQISPLGWQEIARLQEVATDSKIGFVAMAFHDDFLPLYSNALEPGIRAAGYEAKRVDLHPHNNRIDDEIIALIRKSRFLVADFSRNRGGIYFEAGFALGLGLPVIWTVRKDRSERIHFDTRQFNRIEWTADNMPKFASDLQNRIEATIGRGPIQKP